MKLEIISMTPQERMYSYSQSSQIEAQTGCDMTNMGEVCM